MACITTNTKQKKRKEEDPFFSLRLAQASRCSRLGPLSASLIFADLDYLG